MKGETQTMATITIQNYFRMYEKLAGMTGTAETEETEFYSDLQARGRGHPDEPAVIRDDRHDLVYKTRREKYNAIVEETRAAPRAGLSGADRHDERGRLGDAVEAVQARAACSTTC